MQTNIAGQMGFNIQTYTNFWETLRRHTYCLTYSDQIRHRKASREEAYFRFIMPR